jgi:hypothetical protein
VKRWAFERFYDTDVGSEALAALRDYWLDLRGARAMPLADEIDPLHIPGRSLPHVVLVDVAHGGMPDGRPRFRYRLVGTHIVEALGRDLTGRYLDEAYEPEVYDYLTAGIHWLVENRRPMRGLTYAEYAGRGWLPVELLNLPFGGDGGDSVARIMLTLDAGPLPDAI